LMAVESAVDTMGDAQQKATIARLRQLLEERSSGQWHPPTLAGSQGAPAAADPGPVVPGPPELPVFQSKAGCLANVRCVKTGEVFMLFKEPFRFGTESEDGSQVDVDLKKLGAPEDAAEAHATIFYNTANDTLELLNQSQHTIWIDGVECTSKAATAVVLTRHSVIEAAGLLFAVDRNPSYAPALAAATAATAAATASPVDAPTAGPAAAANLPVLL